MSETTFDYHGVELPYFDHMYNLTWFNERRIEVAVAHHHLDGLQSPWHQDQGLEVGNVLGHYTRRCHRVYDLYEHPAWYQDCQEVRDIDLFDVPTWGSDPAFPWVISISTVEHTEDPVKAIEILKSMVLPGGWLLVTFPGGIDDGLDDLVLSRLPGFTRTAVYERVMPGDSQWEQVGYVVNSYGPWANSVAICEWEAPS